MSSRICQNKNEESDSSTDEYKNSTDEYERQEKRFRRKTRRIPNERAKRNEKLKKLYGDYIEPCFLQEASMIQLPSYINEKDIYNHNIFLQKPMRRRPMK